MNHRMKKIKRIDLYIFLYDDMYIFIQIISYLNHKWHDNSIFNKLVARAIFILLYYDHLRPLIVGI